MYLGIDIGTSGVKAVLVDSSQTVVGQATAPLTVQRPRPLWSEQDPRSWWEAVNRAVGQLDPGLRSAVEAVGLSGQMHGATLLDASDAVIRPAILWNDGRSGAACAAMTEALPELHTITGNLAMPGFTAPKLHWLREHESDAFAKVATVLLPKDYVRLLMTGDKASDMSDSAGTLWMDVGARDWSEDVLALTGLSRANMPELFEGSEATGRLTQEVADSWGMGRVPVAGGGGDNAAGAVGTGTISPGDGFISLGTSGVVFMADESFQPNVAGAVHTFCHALPGLWHRMSVILSAASAVDSVARLAGYADVADMHSEVAEAARPADGVVFLPYLSGERTPHNDPGAKGMFFGLSHSTTRSELGQAALEGVAFALADGVDGLRAAGTEIGELSVIGGGARSLWWGRVIASAANVKLLYREASTVGPAYGAARLARLAHAGEDPAAVCTAPAVEHVVEPDAGLLDLYARRRETFGRLYQATQHIRDN